MLLDNINSFWDALKTNYIPILHLIIYIKKHLYIFSRIFVFFEKWELCTSVERPDGPPKLLWGWVVFQAFVNDPVKGDLPLCTVDIHAQKWTMAAEELCTAPAGLQKLWEIFERKHAAKLVSLCNSWWVKRKRKKQSIKSQK